MYFLFIKPNAFHWLIDQIFRGTVKRGKGNSENSLLNRIYIFYSKLEEYTSYNLSV